MTSHTLFEARPAHPDVVVNGKAIPEDQILQEMQHHPAASADEAWHQAAEALVIRELLLQEATRLGLKAEPLIDEGAEEAESDALIRQLVESAVEAKEPDDEVCRSWFEKNRDRFYGPDHWDVSHILVPLKGNQDSDRPKAKIRAEDLLGCLRRSPGDFATLAREHSACSSATDGGRLGLISKGQTTPDFETAMMAMTPGGLSEAPVETPYGYHILRLHAFHEGRAMDWKDAAPRVKEILRENSGRTAVVRFIRQLVESNDIKGLAFDKAPLTN